MSETKGILEQMRSDAVAWISGWMNPSTGQGDPGRDKRAGVVWGGGSFMDERLLESLFAYNDLSHVIVTALPEWGLRHGWDLTLEGSDAAQTQKVESAVRAALDDLSAHERELEAATWGQLYGGGLMLLGLDDGRDTSEPLDVTRLRGLRWVRVVPRRDARIVSTYADARVEGYGRPALYEVDEWPETGGPGERTMWHETRVIRYPGAPTPLEVRRQNKGWDLSVLDRVISKLSQHDSLWDYTSAMMSDGSQGIWKIKGLVSSIARGAKADVEARFQLADKSRSMFRSLLLDADGEDFSYVHRQFSGISDLLAQSAIRTAAAAQMPVTVLFGQSPAGLNATGESDIRLWYDRVESYQERVLRRRTERLVSLILRSKEGPTEGVEPEHWRVTYRPVRKATPMEEAELRARQAQIDTAYISAGVLASLEVAVSRFTSEGWSPETQIDVEARAAAMREAVQRVIEQARSAAATTSAQLAAPAPMALPAPTKGPSGDEVR